MDKLVVPKFHISLPCVDVDKTKLFYLNELGQTSGREAENWIDINFFGHQITFTQSTKAHVETTHYILDHKRLPVFHLGAILDRKKWNQLLEKLKLKLYLEIEPTVFLMDKTGEHDSFFIKDPNGYYIEFKTFNNLNEVFRK
jgi:extradiol dioxygenase family protein